MEPGTWIAFGMFVVAAVATAINVIKAKRDTEQVNVEESSAVIRAKAEMRLGSIEAAERVVAMYGSALTELQRRVTYLEKRVEELEIENSGLRAQLRGSRSLEADYQAYTEGPQDRTVESILEEVRLRDQEERNE